MAVSVRRRASATSADANRTKKRGLFSSIRQGFKSRRDRGSTARSTSTTVPIHNPIYSDEGIEFLPLEYADGYLHLATTKNMTQKEATGIEQPPAGDARGIGGRPSDSIVPARGDESRDDTPVHGAQTLFPKLAAALAKQKRSGAQKAAERKKWKSVNADAKRGVNKNARKDAAKRTDKTVPQTAKKAAPVPAGAGGGTGEKGEVIFSPYRKSVMSDPTRTDGTLAGKLGVGIKTLIGEEKSKTDETPTTDKAVVKTQLVESPSLKPIESTDEVVIGSPFRKHPDTDKLREAKAAEASGWSLFFWSGYNKSDRPEIIGDAAVDNAGFGDSAAAKAARDKALLDEAFSDTEATETVEDTVQHEEDTEQETDDDVDDEEETDDDDEDETDDDEGEYEMEDEPRDLPQVQSHRGKAVLKVKQSPPSLDMLLRGFQPSILSNELEYALSDEDDSQIIHEALRGSDTSSSAYSSFESSLSTRMATKPRADTSKSMLDMLSGTDGQQRYDTTTRASHPNLSRDRYSVVAEGRDDVQDDIDIVVSEDPEEPSEEEEEEESSSSSSPSSSSSDEEDDSRYTRSFSSSFEEDDSTVEGMFLFRW